MKKLLSLVAVLVILTPSLTFAAPTYTFERVSVDDVGTEGDGGSFDPGLSSDGRYVVFTSEASNLVVGDTNGWDDVFVYDRTLDTIERVSLTYDAGEGDSAAQSPSISADGRYIAFHSMASNFVEDDTNANFDIFVYDRTLDTIERVSVGTSTESDGSSFNPSISGDGRYVVFRSNATNLVDGDTNAAEDAFVYDRTLDTTTRVSVSSVGAQNVENVLSTGLSRSGRYALFITSGLLTPEATDGYAHIFAYDLDTDEVELVDVTTDGVEANYDVSSSYYAISDDGRYVAFQSTADNLTVGDTNALEDIFIRDRQENTIERIGDDVEHVVGVGISGDGRYVAFVRSIDEGNEDLNGLYRYDRDTEELLFISEGAEGATIAFSDKPVLSEDGSVLAFYSDATNLVASDTNASYDIFVYEEVAEEEAPAEEEEEDDSSGGGSSHRRTGIERSSSDEDSDIESLTERIEELKQILAGLLGGSPSDDNFLFTHNLTLGDIGDDVLQLQLFLIAHNKGPAAQALGSNGATGYFGPLTQAALAEFQAAVGITPAVGFFGPVTRAYVNAL